MGSVSKFPFVRKPRLASTPKVPRPIMKLEWNKLLAEATEKDVELNKNPTDVELNYDDDECELNSEGGTEKSSNENEEDRPLNLCYKSHTIPSLGNPLDLSSGKKVVDSGASQTPVDSVKQNFCTVPNFQFNQVNSLNVPISDKNTNAEPVIENKENIPNNVKSIYSTPCISKPVFSEKIKAENLLTSKPVFFSEKKPTPNYLPNKPKVIIQEKNKLDFPEKLRSSPDDKKNCIVKAKPTIQQKPAVSSQAPQQQKFAVPAEPPKPKESSRSLVINKKCYQVLAPLGKGGSSKVYLVLNAENELLAVKCVKLSDVSESTKNDYLNEIQHLKKMQHSKHVIKLYDYQYLTTQKLLYAVMERGDTDLSRFLKDKASSDEGISPELIMYYWTEMLLAVKSIHDNNIIHRDLKPANFLLVSGRLKLIDFGIASSIQTEQTSVLMESQSGTFNYMSPEALQDLGFDNKMVLKHSRDGESFRFEDLEVGHLAIADDLVVLEITQPELQLALDGFEAGMSISMTNAGVMCEIPQIQIGRKTDVWSLGCILYFFLYKKTPYQDLVKPLQKMKAITNPSYQVSFPKISGVPDILIESCKRCLIHDTKKRASIEELLAFRNRPLLSLSQVLGKLENALSPEEYEKAAKAFEDVEP